MDYCDEKYSDDEVCEVRLPTFDEACEQENLCREKKEVEEDRHRLLLAVAELGRLRMEMEAKMEAKMEDKMRIEMEAKMRIEMEAKMEAKMEAMEDKMRIEMEAKMEAKMEAMEAKMRIEMEAKLRTDAAVDVKDVVEDVSYFRMALWCKINGLRAPKFKEGSERRLSGFINKFSLENPVTENTKAKIANYYGLEIEEVKSRGE